MSTHDQIETLRAAVIEAANKVNPRDRDTRVAALAEYRRAFADYHEALAAVCA